jgi:hypothetical protein
MHTRRSCLRHGPPARGGQHQRLVSAAALAERLAHQPLDRLAPQLRALVRPVHDRDRRALADGQDPAEAWALRVAR